MEKILPGSILGPLSQQISASTMVQTPIPSNVGRSGAEVRRIPAKIPIQIVFSRTISSKTSKGGDRLAIALAEPLIDESAEILLPAGLFGDAEVIHASKAGFGGRAGELIVAVRQLKCGATIIPIHRLQLSGSGEDSSRFATAMSLWGRQVQGGDFVISEGTRATAYVRTDVEIGHEGGAACGSPADR